ncbi:MAG: cytochrome P450 [Haloarculaceae archaeon]
MSRADQPPAPDGLPVVGNALAFARDPFGAMDAWADLGDVVHLNFPGRSLYMVTDPTLVEQVLVGDQAAFTIGREQRETFEGIEDDAVTAATGERWRRLRTGLQPAFSWSGIEGYGDRMGEIAADHARSWEAGERFDLLGEMRLLTLRVIADTLLGVDVEGDEPVVLDAADALVDWADFRRAGHLLPDWVPTPTDRRFDRAVDRLDEYVANVLAESDPGEGNVLSVLLAARERGDLSTAEVRDNLTGLLLAGHDTTAVALTYAWYELDRHPGVRESLRAEVEAVVGEGTPGADDFDALERTRNAVRETLRLYPPTWSVSREATEPVSLGGYDLPAGTQLILPQWVLHRDGRFWDDPETFDPSRWERDADRPEYAFFPFSGGPRHCIGMRFARLELAVTLAAIVDRVDLDVTADGPLSFAPSLSLRPETEITATVRRR